MLSSCSACNFFSHEYVSFLSISFLIFLGLTILSTTPYQQQAAEQGGEYPSLVRLKTRFPAGLSVRFYPVETRSRRRKWMAV